MLFAKSYKKRGSFGVWQLLNRYGVALTTSFACSVFLVCLMLLGLPQIGYTQDEAPSLDSVLVDSLVEVDIYADEPYTEDEYAYDRPEYHTPPVKPVAMRELDQQQWDDASNGLDYSKDLPKPPKKVREAPSRNTNALDWTNATAFLGKVLQVIAIVLALLAIAYGIYRSLQAPRNRRIGQAEDGTIITAENVDAYIHETDLERFLKAALADGNYPLAIRLYYLQIIKSLSAQNAIKWSKEKTNRDYLREMREHPQGQPFREVTRSFERVWYGNETLDAPAYAKLEPDFKALLGKLA